MICTPREGLLGGVDWLEVVNLSFFPTLSPASLFDFAGCAKQCRNYDFETIEELAIQFTMSDFFFVHHALFLHILTRRRSTDSLALPLNRVSCIRCSTLKSRSSVLQKSITIHFLYVWIFHLLHNQSFGQSFMWRRDLSSFPPLMYLFLIIFFFLVVLELQGISSASKCI